MMCRLATLATGITLAATTLSAETVTLYDQDFEAPISFNNDGFDVNIFRTVNDNFGDQPAGFTFAQAFTVETLNITGSARGGGTAAFGTGWSDPDGRGGNFAIGMLASVENDRLGLSFDAGSFPFFNLGIDVSSIDLSGWGGPFTPLDGVAPEFEFTLYDNPTGGTSLSGDGTILDRHTLTGTASDRAVFDWTEAVLAFDTTAATNGNVVLGIDLLSGGYAALDNFRITASDEEGDLGGGGGPTPPTPAVPLPASLPLILVGAAALAGIRRRSARA